MAQTIDEYRSVEREADKERIAELEALIRDCDNRLREHGDTTLHPLRDRIYRAIGVPTVR